MPVLAGLVGLAGCQTVYEPDPLGLLVELEVMVEVEPGFPGRLQRF